MNAKNPKQYCRQLEDALVDAVSRLQFSLYGSTIGLPTNRSADIENLVADIQARRANGEDIEFEDDSQ